MYMHMYMYALNLEKPPREEACKRKPLKACHVVLKLSCKANLQILPLKPKDPRTRNMAAKRPQTWFMVYVFWKDIEAPSKSLSLVSGLCQPTV